MEDGLRRVLLLHLLPKSWHAYKVLACSSCAQVTHDISNLTCADFLRAPGVQTPVIVRFSTVIHERGSPEAIRDPRGFAVKFYTREGNFDMVGNNFPVFFIRDGMKFPDMVRAAADVVVCSIRL